MNRRGFFSFLPGAAVGVAAAAVIAPPATADNVVRSSPQRCSCGSPMFHMEHVATDASHTHGFAKPVCTWCHADWKGPTS